MGGERYDMALLRINKRIEHQQSGGAGGSSGSLDSFTLRESPQMTSSLNPKLGFRMVNYRVYLSAVPSAEKEIAGLILAYASL